MAVLFLILLLLAVVCFAVAASGRASARVNLVALGLFFWALVPLIQAVQALVK
jgi:hypothetical protein